MKSIKLTSEQQTAVRTAVKLYANGGGYLILNALAGTGKTTTIFHIAKALKEGAKDRKILYIVFNKDAAVSARKIFSGIAEVKTIHSLAYNRVENVKEYMSGGSRNLYQFFSPQDVEDLKRLLISSKTSRIEKQYFSLVEDGYLRMEHDTYLKAFYLALIGRNPFKHIKIDTSISYDIILLDEAQDTNELNIAIFKTIPAKLRIAVGDTHQQIYSFRGAVNAIEKLSKNNKKEKKVRLWLTRSFRFARNSTIENIANKILKYKGENKKVIGCGPLPKENVPKEAIITRSNLGIISIIIEKVFEALNTNTPLPVFNVKSDIIKDKELLLETLEFYHTAQMGRILKEICDRCEEWDPNILHADRFSSIEKKTLYLLGIATLSLHPKSFDFGLCIKLAEKLYRRNLTTQAVRMALSQYKQSNSLNATVLITAHKSKGLEFETVEIGDDFDNGILICIAQILNEMSKQKPYILNDKEENILKDIKQNTLFVNEINLQYVAATRARRKLVNSMYLLFAKEKDYVDSCLCSTIKNIIENPVLLSQDDEIPFQDNSSCKPPAR